MSYTENYPQQQNYFKLEWTLCEDNLSRAHVFFRFTSLADHSKHSAAYGHENTGVGILRNIYSIG